jgi:hypothetical protein
LVSADFKNASDNINPYLTEVAAESISDALGIPWEWRRTISRALTGHTIVYSDIDGDEDQLDQVWGQLMGSPVSFPILCLINAAVTRWAMELSEGGVRMRLADLPLLVNGDDAVFRMRRSGYSTWKFLISAAGLTPSIGKNYVSDTFLTVNTEMYWLSGTFRYVPYLNMAVLYGEREERLELNGKPMGNPGRVKDVGQRMERFLRGFEPRPTIGDSHRWASNVKVMVQEFIRNNKEFLHDANTAQSWWLPRQRGGLGLPWWACDNIDQHVTRKQLAVANHLGKLDRPEVWKYLSRTILETPDRAAYLERTLAALRENNFSLRWLDVDEEGGRCPIDSLVGYCYLSGAGCASDEEDEGVRRGSRDLFERLLSRTNFGKVAELWDVLNCVERRIGLNEDVQIGRLQPPLFGLPLLR